VCVTLLAAFFERLVLSVLRIVSRQRARKPFNRVVNDLFGPIMLLSRALQLCLFRVDVSRLIALHDEFLPRVILKPNSFKAWSAPTIGAIVTPRLHISLARALSEAVAYTARVQGMGTMEEEQQAASIGDHPAPSPERLYWTLSAAVIFLVTLGLLVWHLDTRPDPNALRYICSDGTDANGFPIDGRSCPLNYGSWPAHHWVLSALAVALVILLIGRVLLFMHRMESRAR